ncbi:hypothetical protein RHSIM_Rhsim06G0046800 [Rhododendron simsii]|uniref:Uncharacterized protein n=1 Tax=Rhododendron simsii TaxID=118357 RepID=A0A834LM59_RHOSS|nr:hypothetical protein RHSIM_Rhsim06G0046800 [Rhododendron simsii]
MARAKVLCTSAFLLVLILSYGLVLSEGRQLSNNSGNGSSSGVDSSGGSIADEKENVPVGPGHSPGVGHSVGPTRADP